MIEYILCGTLVLSLVTFYIGYKTGTQKLFDKIADIYFVYVFLHTLFVIFGISFSYANKVIIIANPLILGYAPFFYIGLKSLTTGEVLRKHIYIHFTPLFVFALLYIIVISSGLHSNYFSIFYITEYSFLAVAFLGYAIWAMIVSPFYNNEDNNKEKGQLIKTGAFSLGTIGVLFAITAIAGFVSGNTIRDDLTGTIIHIGILISVAFAFVFRIDNVLEFLRHKTEKVKDIKVHEVITEEERTDSKQIQEEHEKDKKINETQPVQKYNKSALSPAVLDDYKNKLEHLINNEKVYLDNELTLEALAKKMRMPMHHLTQLFNVYLGENFNQYINKFRIEYACGLLVENDGSLSIEQIAFNSGFNSKVSFNRHFKNLTGYTPKEYAYRKSENSAE
ncbi:AraC family transcriptional regulator [Flavobacterium sp. NRK1]|uniref:helix-turn-helix domain-containing protein n=1 Tax=Flavobacterium sp. NRK1 TaxID=2954929 RepID=UPI002093CB7D|nr:helix-turn-helix transcriptional regulator [Flavobacterium sp. NRK1]MCO6148356.1 helix-turn-helix transcriptional regulator [Flavobacterium sp. NRK1]